VINQASGSTGPGAAAELESIVREHGLKVNVRDVPPTEIESAVRAAVAAKPDLVIVLAGDGTARLAASLCGPDGPVVSTLPGGTMNMLPKAFYGDRNWQDSLRCALADPVVRTVSGGEVSGRTFYVAAILGAPALWADAREAIRERHVWSALRRSVRAGKRAFHGALQFSLDGGPVERAEALSLLCPLISKAMDEQTALEAAAVDPIGAVEAFRMAFRYAFGEWRNDPAIHTRPCKHGRAMTRGSMPAILDGESIRLKSPVEIRFIPRAFKALEPRRDVGEPRV
jgi:diacylglycerol kinase family enzyme